MTTQTTSSSSPEYKHATRVEQVLALLRNVVHEESGNHDGVSLLDSPPMEDGLRPRGENDMTSTSNGKEDSKDLRKVVMTCIELLAHEIE